MKKQGDTAAGMESECREKALFLLERRGHSRAELELKLKSRHFEDATVQRILADLERVGLINDLEFAKSYAEYRLYGSRPIGRHKLIQELRKRGIDNHIIEAVLETIWESNDDAEWQRALEAGRRKWESALRRNDDLYKAKGKVYRFLAGRGFAADICRRVLENLAD